MATLIPEAPAPAVQPQKDTPPKPPAKPKWHLIYYLLALFDILTVSGSLYLNHQIMGIYVQSVEESTKWNNRLVAYSKIWQIASDVNAPGNDVFDNHDVVGERSRRDQNLAVFNQTLIELQEDLKNEEQTPDTEKLANEMKATSFFMDAMVEESDMIFQLFSDGKGHIAGSRMATMDRKYAKLNSSLVNLNLIVGSIAQKHFKKQVENALYLKQYEYLFGGLVLFMVLAVTLYGNMVARKVRTAEEEKEKHLTTLEQNKVDLEKFSESVEEAWNQTKRYNQELIEINQRLHDEIQYRKTIQNKNEKLVQRLEGKNKELTEFNYIASHDLQEPLRKILAFGDRLKTRLNQEDDTGQDYMNRIQNAAKRMSNLINALLELSYLNNDSNPFQETDLNEVMEEVLEDLEMRIKDNGAKVQVEPLPVIHANWTQMKQLFQNLVSNSLKFAQKDLPPEINMNYALERGQHKIVLRDNGIGFDEKYASKIFKPFERLNGRNNFEGTGIGLSICKKIIDHHHGNIEVTSKPNAGTTFIISLPEDAHAADGDDL